MNCHPARLLACAIVAGLAPACSRDGKSGAGLPLGTTHAESPQHPRSWFSADEISQRLGVAVAPGRIAGPLGTWCQWSAVDDPSTFVQIQVVRDVSFWSVPSQAPGFVSLPSVGEEAFVLPDDGGWKAAARLPASFVIVLLRGAPANAALAGRLLVDTVSRAR